MPTFQVSGRNSLALPPERVGVPLLPPRGWAVTVTVCRAGAEAESTPSWGLPKILDTRVQISVMVWAGMRMEAWRSQRRQVPQNSMHIADEARA